MAAAAATGNDNEHPFACVIRDPRFQRLLAKWALQVRLTTSPEMAYGMLFSYIINVGITMTVGFEHRAVEVSNGRVVRFLGFVNDLGTRVEEAR
ncbi:MAG: hypothetical protein ACTSX8_02725, partial [Alphaproteobacteria bacterium]